MTKIHTDGICQACRPEMTNYTTKRLEEKESCAILNGAAHEQHISVKISDPKGSERPYKSHNQSDNEVLA